jgi:sugar/nucleoside kinase (ribokinase family)
VERLGLARGTMTLVDAARAEELYGALGPSVECSGGSAANTIAGLAALGVRTAFVGRVRDDQLGRVFAHDIRAVGVRFETPAAVEGPPTALCLVMVTPDGHRTMCTYLGASVELGPQDVDRELVASAAVTYVEAYLWDPPQARAAVRAAMATARAAGRTVALSLSDPFCVERHRAELRALVEAEVDVLFANEYELVSLFEVGDVDDALQAVRGRVGVAAITRSEHGSVVASADEVHVVPAAPVARVVDTTGAGDLYAAGFLAGYVRGATLAECARMGGLCAAEVISHLGARPRADLRALVG